MMFSRLGLPQYYANTARVWGSGRNYVRCPSAARVLTKGDAPNSFSFRPSLWRRTGKVAELVVAAGGEFLEELG